MDKLNKKDCELQLCNFSDIRHIFEDFHYRKGHMGGGISVCFAMLINNQLVGGSVLGKPRHETKYKNCIDIRRMACLDDAPFNSESWFLGSIIKYLIANTEYDTVLSYSDLTQGHIGTIYKATNFIQSGKTSPTKYVEWNGKTYHMRSLTIDRPYSYEMRKAVDEGKAIVKTGEPKIIWLYDLTKRRKRKNKLFLKRYGVSTLEEFL
tara:strand:- start:15429 stop:16049 length:621 start_codon:yes stop_codon:yes gene_type:complete